jgi:hypothetical protein
LPPIRHPPPLFYAPPKYTEYIIHCLQIAPLGMVLVHTKIIPYLHKFFVLYCFHES